MDSPATRGLEHDPACSRALDSNRDDKPRRRPVAAHSQLGSAYRTSQRTLCVQHHNLGSGRPARPRLPRKLWVRACSRPGSPQPEPQRPQQQSTRTFDPLDTFTPNYIIFSVKVKYQVPCVLHGKPARLCGKNCGRCGPGLYTFSCSQMPVQETALLPLAPVLACSRCAACCCFLGKWTQIHRPLLCPNRLSARRLHSAKRPTKPSGPWALSLMKRQTLTKSKKP